MKLVRSIVPHLPKGIAPLLIISTTMLSSVSSTAHTITNEFPTTAQQLAKKPPKIRKTSKKIKKTRNTNQAIQKQAKEIIATLNRQQISNIEGREGITAKFARDFDILDIPQLAGADTAEYGDYTYLIDTDEKSISLHVAIPKKTGLKAYLGIVNTYIDPSGLKIYQSIVCESKQSPIQSPPISSNDIEVIEGQLACPPDYLRAQS
jgi:Type IV pilin-like G and H, putative